MPGKVYYPIFLDLSNRPVIVAGGGKVALRKIRGLVEAGARVTVIAPEIDPAIGQLPVTINRREYRPGDLEGATLAFAATDCRETNQAIQKEAAILGVWVNVADAAAECAFLVPARINRGTLQIAVSTGGTDPRLAAALRRQLERVLDEGVSP